MESTLQIHRCLAKRVLRYLSRAPDHEIMMGNVRGDQNGQTRCVSGLYGYIGTDWARDTETTRSTSGHAKLFRGGLVELGSSKHECIVASSCEYECIALSERIHKIRYYWLLLKKYEKDTSPTIVYENKQACTSWVKKEGRINKHINVRCRVC